MRELAIAAVDVAPALETAPGSATAARRSWRAPRRRPQHCLRVCCASGCCQRRLCDRRARQRRRRELWSSPQRPRGRRGFDRPAFGAGCDTRGSQAVTPTLSLLQQGGPSWPSLLERLTQLVGLVSGRHHSRGPPPRLASTAATTPTHPTRRAWRPRGRAGSSETAPAGAVGGRGGAVHDATGAVGGSDPTDGVMLGGCRATDRARAGRSPGTAEPGEHRADGAPQRPGVRRWSCASPAPPYRRSRTVSPLIRWSPRSTSGAIAARRGRS